MLSQSENLISPSSDGHTLSILFDFLGTMELHTAQTVSKAWFNAVTNEKKKRIGEIDFYSPLSSLTIRELILDKMLLRLAKERIDFLLEQPSRKEDKAKEAIEKYKQSLENYPQGFSTSGLSEDQLIENTKAALELVKKEFENLKFSLKGYAGYKEYFKVQEMVFKSHAQELKEIKAIIQGERRGGDVSLSSLISCIRESGLSQDQLSVAEMLEIIKAIYQGNNTKLYDFILQYKYWFIETQLLYLSIGTGLFQVDNTTNFTMLQSPQLKANLEILNNVIHESLIKLMQLIQKINKIPEDVLDSARQAAISNLKDQTRQIYYDLSLSLSEIAEKLKKSFNDFKLLEKHLNQFDSIQNRGAAKDEYGSAIITNIQTAKKNAYYMYANNHNINECIASFDEAIASFKKTADKDENFRPSLMFFSDYRPAKKPNVLKSFINSSFGF